MKDFKKILERLHYWDSVDEEIQNAYNNFCLAVAPDSYSIVPEHSLAKAFMEGVAYDNESLKDWLEYHIFETDDNQTWSCRQGGIECENANDVGLFAEFLDKIFNETL